MALVSGESLWWALTQQFTVWAGVPHCTLLGNILRYIPAPAMNNDEITPKQQSTIDRERVLWLWVGEGLLNHPTISDLWYIFIAKIRPDMKHFNPPNNHSYVLL